MERSRLTILVLSIAGLLFSGYLTFTKLFSQTCSLSEGCQYLWGYPTCMYGFIFFSLLFIIGILAMVMKRQKCFMLSIVSGLAVLFSGYFVIIDIIQWTGHYSLGLPSCVYGFVMFVLIFILSFVGKK